MIKLIDGFDAILYVTMIYSNLENRKKLKEGKSQISS